MKVRLLKDWSFHKTGDIAEVFEPTAVNWMQNGIAEAVVDRRSVPVETTDDSRSSTAERAERKPSRRP